MGIVPDGTPRASHEPSPSADLWNRVKALEESIRGLQRGANLRNSSISGGDGQKVYDETGNLRLSIDVSGSVTAYGEDELPVARYGLLEDSAPGEYGVEINVDGGWVRLGYQTTGWSQIQKPAAYDVATEKWDPTPHTHPGGDVTSQVASAATATTATSATNATLATQAEGSQYGWTNTVGGTEFYQLWVGNNGGYKFGRNTSSRKYKMNIRPVQPVAGPAPDQRDPRRILKLVDVIYDRRPTTDAPLEDGEVGPVREYPGVKNELGLIAEETAQHVPEIVTHYQGQIDGVRYELLGVVALPLLKLHEEQLGKQASEIEQLKQAIRNMGGTI
jgi:hypothetical protein